LTTPLTKNKWKNIMLKAITKFGNFWKKTLDNNTVILVYALFLSVLIWLVVSINIYPTAPKTYTDIELEINTAGTSAEQNNLNPVSIGVENVTVTIAGNRSQIGKISKDEIFAVAKPENVTSPGEYELNISIQNSTGIGFDVTNISPQTVKVYFDEIVSKDFAVIPDHKNIVPEDENYFFDDVIVTPEIVKIKGAKTRLDKVATVKAVFEDSEKLSDAATFHTSKLSLFDADNTLLDVNEYTMPTLDLTMDIPVYEKRDLKLQYAFQNAPKGFDTSTLNFSLSNSYITVGASKNILGTTDTFDLGYIDIKTLSLDTPLTFDIALPENYKNISNINQVTATLENEGYFSKKITMSGNKLAEGIKNKPADFDINLITQYVTFKVNGPSEIVKDLTVDDVVVEIDLSDLNIEVGTFQAPIDVVFTSNTAVWAEQSEKISFSATRVSKPTI
jgi:YbbR domain-containing protein